MYVDNAPCSWSRPQAFDVIVTGNMFGDILSDEASMLTGSIGMLPSASLNDKKQGPVRAQPRQRTRTSPGKGHRQPLATILSAAMMLRFSLNQEAAAQRIEAAVQGAGPGACARRTSTAQAPPRWGPAEMGDAVQALG